MRTKDQLTDEQEYNKKWALNHEQLTFYFTSFSLLFTVESKSNYEKKKERWLGKAKKYD